MNGIPSTPKKPIRSLYAFIQARTGSTRFPKKVLAELPPGSGKTILEHIHARIRKVLPADKIVYLIPEGDAELADFLSLKKMRYFVGPLEDVRQRYSNAAEHFGADAILRLTGDNPFYDTLHLELLLQAFSKEECDLSYFKGLPLGTGGEVFRTSALDSLPENGWEERHKEHVSLHIKEDPNRFRIVPIPAILTKKESERIPHFRLTVDTPEDFQTVSDLLTKKNPEVFSELGVYDFLRMEEENPVLFRKNLDIPQVRFPLPDPERTPKKGKIAFLVAPAKEYGSGHFARSSILFSLLPFRNWEPAWLREFPKDGEYEILLIDHRDIEIPFEYKRTKVLLLDHFGKDRKNYPHWDVLPHPENESDFDWNRILLPPALFSSEFRTGQESKKYDLFCYSGSLGEAETQKLDSFFRTYFSGKKVLRVGGQTPEKDANIEYASRLSRPEYLNALASSRSFLGYFGQSLFEALYLKIPSATFSISPVHESLSKLLEKRGVPVSDLRSMPEFSLGNGSPGPDGYDLLLEKIEDCLGS
ncbi:spore coat biosynthesis protein F [Leptospira wolffii]|uniref:cytidylyltransferase domain-containing protein n=1 Tax=Leptospira wolffii TaxID=409998 RepID=UPI0010847C7A|nr:spore coat biosynthesis protein F [Leptospira wolffii]TGK58224.1 spore coat biosynthesis protein F [Leptospira wolffii]TGK66400.1 spore coat biosynthesis protein F [Leptospira wolffii]TGK68902.1 spore coat biosynthesis protein F [Leptospira wolffii]TGL27254.1 spore coat biosynthesis protein F [Leptospira wolffii]